MTWVPRSVARAGLLALSMLLAAAGADARSPVPSASPLSPMAGSASWAQVVHRPDGGTDVVVGQLGTAAIPVLSQPVEIHLQGPEADWFLAWWRRDGWTTVVQLESRGSVRQLLRTRDVISAAALDPGVDHWTWAVAKDDGSLAEIRRAKTYPDRPTAGRVVAAGSDLPAIRLIPLDPGRTLGVELLAPTGHRLRIVDLRSGARWRSAFEGRLRVIGRQGGELIAGMPRDGEVIAAPLVAIDPATGAARSITTSTGTGAYLAEDGALVWDETGEDGMVRIRSQELGGVPRTVATQTAPGAVLASTSGTARAGSSAVAALVPDGSWLTADDADGAIVTVDLETGTTGVRPAFTPLAPTGIAWDRPPMVGVVGLGGMESITRWKGGLVAVARESATGRGVVWRSADGERWERSVLPDATTKVSGPLRIVGDGRRLLLAGFIPEPDHRVAVWTSTDGRRWTAMPARPALRFSPERALFVNLIDAGVLDGRWFLTAQRCVEGCRDPVILASRDGRRWSRAEGPEGATWIAGGAGRFIADGVTPDEGRIVSASRDGVRWERLGETPAAAYHHHLIDTPGGMVLVASSAYDAPLTVWRSSDGSAWELVHTDELPWELQATARDGDRIVLLGRALIDPERSAMRAASLISLDGGRTWSRSTGTREPAGSRIMAATFDGTRIVAAGSTLEPRPALWAATLPG